MPRHNASEKQHVKTFKTQFLSFKKKMGQQKTAVKGKETEKKSWHQAALE